MKVCLLIIFILLASSSFSLEESNEDKTEKQPRIYIPVNTETNLNITYSKDKIIYESKQEKSTRSALLLFCGLLILFIIKIKTENGKRNINS